MNAFGRNFLFWVAIILTLAFLFNTFNNTQQNRGASSNKIAYSEFVDSVRAGNVSEIKIKGQNVTGTYSNSDDQFSTMVPEGENIVERIGDAPVRVEAEKRDEDGISLLGILVSWFPMLLLIGVWIFFMRQMQGGKGGGAMGFGKSKARMLTEDKNKVTFRDVAGVDEAKQELEEVVEFLKAPDKFQRLGGKIPKGCLLVGPPGTGKTLIAKAVAGEANVPFYTISGSDFVEMLWAWVQAVSVTCLNRPRKMRLVLSLLTKLMPLVAIVVPALVAVMTSASKH